MVGGRAARALVGLGTWLGLAVAATTASVVFHLDLPRSRRLARELLVSLASQELRGDLEIGRFISVSPDGILVEDLVLRDVDGVAVIHIDVAELTPGLEHLWNGAIVFETIEARGVRLRLREEMGQAPEEPLPSFIRAFEPAQPGSGDDGGGGPRVVLGALRLRSVRVDGTIVGRDGIEASLPLVDGRLVIEDGEVEVFIWRGQGLLTEPYPFDAEILQVEGKIDTRPTEGITLYAHVRGRRDDPRAAQDDVRARFRYRLPDDAPEGAPRHMDLRAQLDPLFAETLEDVGIDAAEPLTGPLWGTLRLEGPENDLTLRLDLDTLGGPLTVDGRIAGPEVTVDVDADRLALHRVIEGLPELPVGGRVQVRIAPTPEQTDAPERLMLSADLDPFVVDGWQVPPIRAEGSLSEGVVTIDRFEAPAGGGDVQGSGRVDEDGTVTLDVRARLPALSREPNLARVLPGAEGQARTELTIRVAGERVDIDGRIVLLDVVYPPFRASRLVAEGKLAGRPERPQVRLDIEVTDGSVAGYPLGDGTGTIAGGPTRYALGARFQASRGRRLVLDAVARRAGPARWTLDAPRVELAAGQRERASYEGHIDALTVDFDAKSYELEELLLLQGTQRVVLAGRYAETGPADVALALQDVRVDALVALLPGVDATAGGRLDAEATVSGETPDARVLRVEGGFREGRLETVEDLAGAFRFEVGKGEATVDVLVDLGEDGGAVGISGGGLLDGNAESIEGGFLGGVYELSLELASLDLARVAAAFRLDVPISSAPTTGELTVSGSPFAPNIEASIESPAVAVVDGPTLPFSTSFDYDTGVLVGKAVVGEADDPLLRGKASLLFDLTTLLTSPETSVAALETLPWRVELVGPRRRLDTLPSPWRELLPPILGPARVWGSVTLAGGSAPVHGDGEIVVDWDPKAQHLLPCPGLDRPRVALAAVLEEGVTSVTAEGFLDDEKVLVADVRSETPIDAWVDGTATPGWPMTSLDGRARAVPVDALPGLCGRATGSITGELEVADLFGEAPRARMLAATPDFRAGRGQLIRATAEATASAASGLATAIRIRWPGNERAELDLSLPLVWGGDDQPLPDRAPGATLETDARFVAAPIGAFLLPIEEIAEGSGFLTGELRIHGPLTSFDIDGEVRFEEGSIDVVPLGQQLRGVEGTVDFRGDWARIRQLRARDGDGSVVVDGSVAFRGPTLRSANLAINGQRFPVRQEGAVLARVTTNAQLEATFLEEAAQVDLDLASLDVALPDQSGSTVQALDPHPDIVIVGREGFGDEDEDEDGPPYLFVFDVETKGTSWVRRSDFSAEIRADFDAVVEDDTLRLAGTVELLRGLFEVFGKRFEVQRGGLAFSGSEELNPGVSLVAIHTLPSGDDTVTVNVGGTLLSPTVDFSSTHPTCRADEEVIALLVSGACSVADTFAASGESVAAEQQALNFLAGITAGVLTLGARRQFGDVVPVLVIESGDTAFQSARVRAGFRADSLIPDFLQGIVRGLYIEGQVTAEQGAAVTGEGEAQSEGPTGAAFSGGFLFELRFPYDLVGRTTFESSSNAWSVDLTWEP